MTDQRRLSVLLQSALPVRTAVGFLADAAKDDDLMVHFCACMSF